MAKRKIKRTARKDIPQGKAGIPKKASMAIYVIVLLAAVAARTEQLYNNMDFSTGRYIDGSLSRNYTLMILAVGFVLLALVLKLGSSRDKVVETCILINPMRLRYDRLNKKIPSSAGYSALLMAFLMPAEIIGDFISLINKNDRIIDEMPAAEAEDYSRLTGYNGAMAAEHILMILVMLTFISIAVNIFKGEGLSHANCAALSTYAIWQTKQIFELVMNNVSLSVSSEPVYILFSKMAAVIFFLNTARLFNGMEKKNTRFWMCFMGYAASILAAVSVLPRYLMLLSPEEDVMDKVISMRVPEISDVGIIFMTITIITSFWTAYVYRNMPKLNISGRRHLRAPLSTGYQEMESIDESEFKDQ